MEYRQLGRSGLKVSVLSMGTMTFGGGGAFAKVGANGVEEFRRQWKLCRNAGVNLIDTANIYSTGASEEIIGEAMQGDWGDTLIATKARFPMGKGANDAGLSRHHLINECKASLKRLRVDHIDLYQVHEWDGLTPLEETMEALATLVRHGHVRYVGCSNFSGWHIMKAQAIAAQQHGIPFISQQIHYTLEAREAEYELVPISLDQGLGILVWSPIAGGLLSGKYRRGKPQPEGTRQIAQWGEPPIYNEERLYDIVEVLVEIGESKGVSAAQIALAWLLTRPAVSTLIIGGRTDEQFADNLKSVEVKLSDDEVRRLEEVSRPPLLYPYWHQVRTASDRLGPADLSFLERHKQG